MLSVEHSVHVRIDLEKSGPFIGVGGMAVSLLLYGYTAIVFASRVHTLVPVLSIAVCSGAILTLG